jgi:hypothetical protein
MIHQFQKHYTREDARSLLPQVRQWLQRLTELRDELEQQDEDLGKLISTGRDLGGHSVDKWVGNMAAIKETLSEFQRREIQLKDLDRGLIDFPAIIGDKEVYLCWERSEDDIAYWHDLEAGYAGREPLED